MRFGIYLITKAQEYVVDSTIMVKVQVLEPYCMGQEYAHVKTFRAFDVKTAQRNAMAWCKSQMPA